MSRENAPEGAIIVADFVKYGQDRYGKFHPDVQKLDHRKRPRWK